MKTFLSIFFTGTLISFGQSLVVSEGSSISINSNSSVSVDGLVLAPSQAYTFSGPTSLTRSSEPIVVGNNTSINRVYDLSSELSNFTGIVTFSYQDSELNNILEANLVLEVMDANDVWTSVAPNVDASNNNLTYDFTGIVEISKVTASDASSTLTITSETLNSFVRVYPNPTTEKLFIVSKTSQKASLFNVAGQKLLESNATELDVTDLPSGIYLLNLQNTQNQISTFKIIKK
jgi:hypothetical protein